MLRVPYERGAPLECQGALISLYVKRERERADRGQGRGRPAACASGRTRQPLIGDRVEPLCGASHPAKGSSLWGGTGRAVRTGTSWSANGAIGSRGGRGVGLGWG